MSMRCLCSRCAPAWQSPCCPQKMLLECCMPVPWRWDAACSGHAWGKVAACHIFIRRQLPRCMAVH